MTYTYNSNGVLTLEVGTHKKTFHNVQLSQLHKVIDEYCWRMGIGYENRR